MYLSAVRNQGRLPLPTSDAAADLSAWERLILAVGIIEIPVGVDKSFGHAEEHAQWGALGGLNVSVTTLCFALLYVFWLFRLMRRETPAPTLLGIPQICYLVAVALSALAAEVRMLAVCDLFMLLQAYAIFFYIANRFERTKALSFVIGCLAVALAIQGLIMIGQKALGESAFGQTYQISMVKFDVWEDGRTAGTMHSAVLAGSWLAITWLVVLPLVIAETQRERQIFWGLCLTIGMLGMLFTQTRGAVLTVGIGGAMLAAGMFRRGWLPRWFFKAGIMVALLAIIPLVQIAQKRVIRGDEGSAESRRHLSLIAVKTISQNPVWGYGAGNCHLACLPVANSAEFRSEWYYTVHCKYLLVWIESGIFGILAFMAILASGMRDGLKAWSHRHPLLSPVGLACTTAIAGHMVHMLVDIFNSRPQVQTLWLVLGIAAATWRLSRLPTTPPGSPGGAWS